MGKWPKEPIKLTQEEKSAIDDHMKRWHETSQKKFLTRFFENFNHSYPMNNCSQGGRVLEIGAGIGGHILHEELRNTDYYALELRPEMGQKIVERFPEVNVIIGDCQKHLPFEDDFFDRVLAIHVLEHLLNLPATLKEVSRALKPEGEFCIVIPCEGSLAYKISRALTSKPMFEKRYGISYDVLVKAEHVNYPWEIMHELDVYFDTYKKSFFPLKIPSVNLNLCIGMVLKPKKHKINHQHKA